MMGLYTQWFAFLMKIRSRKVIFPQSTRMRRVTVSKAMPPGSQSLDSINEHLEFSRVSET